MSWYKVLLDSPEAGLNLMTIAQQVDEAAGKPNGFALFSGIEIGGETTRFAYYFSPVAAPLCLPYLAQFSPVPCDKPTPSDPDDLMPGFGAGLSYGSPSAWDLLK